MIFNDFSRRTLLLLPILCTLIGCGQDVMKDPVVPRSRATQDALNCAAFFESEDDLYASLGSCQYDSDCTAVNVGANYFTTCTNGMLAVNRWANPAYLTNFQAQYASACQRVTPACGAGPAPTVPKCSSAGYCYLSQ